MNWLLLLEQILNGFQLGLLLFLLAAGLTLVFGIMDMINLAHGSLYMMGAYFCATFTSWTGSFLLGALLTLPAVFLLGVLVELVALRTLYTRDHLDQVMATFGLILFFNEATRLIWGPVGLVIPLPDFLSQTVEIIPDAPYPAFRLLIIIVGFIIAGLLYFLVTRTRLGMLIRAGASNREMIGALGINIRLLFTLVFGLGAALAGLAGLMAGPILSVEIGMGESILILTLVVIVIGGIGSIKGAFIAAILIGLIDTVGRSFLPELLDIFLPSDSAATAAPAIASMLIYLLMALILAIRPQGLFPPKGVGK
ncbi:MAG: branched-chain amino acid ABC transporter permease [Sneathiella sp.]|jgi:branched-chain amino acid transport system permease protein|uniref:branched-chain amino acid ABC transporter permease n=1 Tax=Sneathiella sp. TaxID=1964365 RepID=UPI000C4C886F|nr:branched-chain amino acid ABC transporter permease [Sneathiella sp.]MAL79758.1 branched-chain amino acid ABC transporter permease [Sneathiella sp.]|tara:strand:- start:659 stop:1588 length:930 start_codon:yes stop_codon:yes gene_type:complete